MQLLLQTNYCNCYIQEGFSPLILASQDGNIDVVKVLLEHDTELDISFTTKVFDKC